MSHDASRKPVPSTINRLNGIPNITPPYFLFYQDYVFETHYNSECKLVSERKNLTLIQMVERRPKFEFEFHVLLQIFPL